MDEALKEDGANNRALRVRCTLIDTSKIKLSSAVVIKPKAHMHGVESWKH